MGVHRRLVGFLNTTFYDNEYAFRCTIAGLSMALLGENVDRACWAIGSGGAGQSLFATLIRNAINPMRGFFDCTSLYLDDELRKTLEHIVGYCVLAAQEGAEGGSANIRNIRQGIYKKIRPGDPISCRLPYAKSSKMVSTRWMLRFELNQALTFHNVKEEQRGSIYRRSLVIKMNAKFLPSEWYNALPIEIKDTKGVFSKDAALKKFIEPEGIGCILQAYI